MTNTETSDDLLIRARQAFDDVFADPDRFRPAAEALVTEVRRARQPEVLALALRAMAWAERFRLDDRSAIRLLDEACQIARRHHLHQTLAELLMSRAFVRLELGRIAAAQRDLRAAAALVSGPGLVELDFHQAVLLQNIGRLDEAAVIYQRLLSGSAATARRKVQSANNLALIESEQGRYRQALRRLGEALSAAVAIGPALTTVIIQSRAWVTVQSGRFAEGLRMFEEAAQAYRDAALPLGEHYIEYADALTDLRLVPEAAEASRRAAEEFSAAGVPLMAAEAQLRVARLALLAGDTAEAGAAATAAAAAFRRQARAAWRARAILVKAEAQLRSGTATLSDLGEVRAAARRLDAQGTTSAAVQGFLVAGMMAASLGRRRQAIAGLTRAGSLARGAPVLVRLRGRLSSALAARMRHQDREALAHCRRGLTDLARHRGALPSVELRALASGHGAELGLIGLDVVIKDGSPARVLNWMERSRAAALLVVEPPAFDHLRDDLTALRAVQAGLRDERIHGSRPAALAYRGAEQAVIESRIRRATWRAESVAGTSAAPITVGGLRDRLDGQVLIAYGLLDGDLLAVVIEPRSSRITALGPLAQVREQLRAFQFALRRLTRNSQQAPLAAARLAAARLSADERIRRLSGLLLQPLRVSADAELVIVPLADLQGVPWVALHRGPVCLAPSATFWARSAQAAQAWPRGRTDNSVVVVAGPDLPGAVAEVQAVAGIHPAATRITPPASTADTVAAAVADAHLVHLACHGTLRADNPMFSSLLLSDGPLTVQELYARGVAPRRLVLASCESGSQVSYTGDETLGFVSALLARGTAGILASTAVVPDVETVDLMTAVHLALSRGATLARALHEARESQNTDNPRSYVNWCAFNAHGAG